MKQKIRFYALCLVMPAAFGRLCVETAITGADIAETATQPPSGGCVLKQNVIVDIQPVLTSRLRAAVC